MTSQSKWEVHSWHISVPIGESAIHLLAERKVDRPSTVKPTPPTIHRAILIDGGKPHGAAASSIRDVIAVIQERYQFADGVGFEDDAHYVKPTTTPSKSLRFDAVVISHWDTDHYEGVFGLLEQGFEMCFEKWKKTQLSFPPTLTWSSVLSGKFILTSNGALPATQLQNPPEAVIIPCWYLKYTKSGTSQGTPAAPAAPEAWQALPGNTGTSLEMTISGFERRSGFETATRFYVAHPVKSSTAQLDRLGPLEVDARHALVALQALNGTASIKASLAVNVDIVTSTGLSKKNVLLTQLGDVFHSHELYLGVDLFTGTKPDDWKSVSSPLQLVEQFGLKIRNTGTSAKSPGFFIVAGNLAVLGNLRPTMTKPAFSLKPNFDSSKTPGTPTPPGVVNATPDDNSRSIVTIGLVERAKSKGFDVLHYSGGDTTLVVENAIATWLVQSIRSASVGTGGSPTDFTCFGKAMKLSRHGSRGAASSGLLNALQSRYYFVSPSQYGAKRHPDVETILMLYGQHAFWTRYLLESAVVSDSGIVDIDSVLESIRKDPPFKKPATGPSDITDEELLALLPGLDSFFITPRLPFWIRDPKKATSVANLTGKPVLDVDWINASAFKAAKGTDGTDTPGDYLARMAGQLPDPLASYRVFTDSLDAQKSADDPTNDAKDKYSRLAGHISEIWPQICDVQLPRGDNQREKAIWFQLGENTVEARRLLGDYSLVGVGYGPAHLFVAEAGEVITATAPDSKPIPAAADSTQMDDKDPDDTEPMRLLDLEVTALDDKPLWVKNRVFRLPPPADLEFAEECTVLVPSGTTVSASKPGVTVESAELAAGTVLGEFVSLLPNGYVVADGDEESYTIESDAWGNRLPGIGLGISAVGVSFQSTGDAKVSASLNIPGRDTEVTFSTHPLQADDTFLAKEYGMLWLKPEQDGTDPVDLNVEGLLKVFVPSAGDLNFGGFNPKGEIDVDKSGLFLQADAFTTAYLRLTVKVIGEEHISSILKIAKKLIPSSNLPTPPVEVTLTNIRKSTTVQLGGTQPEEDSAPPSNAGKYVSNVISQTIIYVKVQEGFQFWIIFEADTSRRVIFQIDSESLGATTERVKTIDALDVDVTDLKLADSSKYLIPTQDTAPSSGSQGSISGTKFRVDVSFGGPRSYKIKLSCLFKLFGMDFLVALSFPQPRISADLYKRPSHPLFLPWTADWDEIQDSGSGAQTDIKTLTDNPTPSNDGLHLILTDCHIDGGLVGGAGSREVQGNLRASAQLKDLPLAVPSSVAVRASFSQKDKLAPQWAISLGAEWSLSETSDARLTLAGSWTNGESGSWLLAGEVRDLRFAELAGNYFPEEDGDTLAGLFESLAVPYLGVRYSHPHNAAEDRTLNVAGTVELGAKDPKIRLMFQYNHVSTPKPRSTLRESRWSFTATLDRGNEGSSLLDVIAGLIPGDEDDHLIESLQELPLLSDYVVPKEDETGNALKLQLKSTSDAIIMVLEAQIHTGLGTLTAVFAQYKTKPKQGTNLPTNVKRYIRLRIGGLPSIKNVPVVGEIVPPIDALDYIFVQDKPPTTTTQPPDPAKTGLTSVEIAEINKMLDPTDFILVREATSSTPQTPPPTNTPAKVVVRGGHHFMVISDGRIVLDHLFGGASTSKNNSKGRNQLMQAPNTPAEEGPTHGALKKSFANISITDLGIELRDQHVNGANERYVFLLIGARAMLGGLELEMEGFGIGLPLKKLAKPHTIKPGDIIPTISGLGVNFERGGLAISGGFTIEKTLTEALYAEEYMGGIFVSGIGPYALTGVGGYRSQKPVDSSSPEKAFRSVFCYARIDGILFTIEIGEISGVAASFGYNYDMTVPTGATIEDFPLLRHQGENIKVMDLISKSGGTKSFKHWLTPGDKSFFFSFGMTVSSCHIIVIEAAVLLRAASAKGFSISIVGRGTASFPPATPATTSKLTFLYVEIGFVATLDPGRGQFSLEAQLGPKSHLLTEECRLTGGFAFRSWFPPSPYAGDWYFSIGGFHPAFLPPKHWSLPPPRVAITWAPLPALKIRGSGFFAITPKAVMGGGELEASFSAAVFFAEFRVWASFLINYTPFFFIAEIGVRVSVGVSINIGICTIRKSGQISAMLLLQGPPISGYLKARFMGIPIKVSFGSKGDRDSSIEMDKFIELVRKPGLAGPSSDGKALAAGAAADAGTGAGKDLVVISLSQGAAPETVTKTESKPRKSEWHVRAGTFRFRVESKFALSEAVINSNLASNDGADPIPRLDAREAIYAKPTHVLTPLESRLKVHVKREGEKEEGEGWIVEPVYKNLPNAVWEKYDSGNDPVASQKGNNNLPGLLSSKGPGDSTKEHLVGYDFTPPKPQKPDPKVQLPMFDAVVAMQEGLFREGDEGTEANPAKKIHPRARLVPTRKAGDGEPEEMRPVMPTSADPDSSPELEAEDGGRAAVRMTDENADATWTPVEGIQGLVDEVVGAFRWKVIPATGKDVTAPVEGSEGAKAEALKVKMKSGRPDGVVGHFKESYMSFPFVSKGMGSVSVR